VKRTLIVGDVHGCLRELQDLLSLASIGANDDVVFVGDLVARGPDSLGVLELAMNLDAKSVQGNHERKLLRAFETESRCDEKVRLTPGHRRLMQELKAEHWEFMKAMPLYWELPQHRACVVHAGVLPGVPLAQQDPWILTHVRSIDSQGMPSTELNSPLWATQYRGPTHLVFGHSAQVGLQLNEHATGLDSGCVYGGRLTGLLLDEGQPVPTLDRRRDSILSVAAHGVYFRP
jgi:hypothetical protein